jgi:pimeloyl-ACP methyl ester carboxylesterase
MGSTYVLVHGAWHGGWSWTPVVRRLTELGHKVYAPTLAGHGPDVERAGITHADCVTSLIHYIEARDLRDMILVGHSWGGNILCGAAPLIAGRLQRLIFQSALVLNDGESMLEAYPPHLGALVEQLASQTPDRSVTLPWETWRRAFMQDSGEEAARLAYSLLTPVPMAVFVAKLDQKAFFKLNTPRSYIMCRQDLALPPGGYQRFGDRLGKHKLVEMDGSHEVGFTRPIELADAIIEASSD